MRRRIVLLAVFLLLATSMPSGQVFAQGLPPHKDPRAEKSEFSALAMLGYFASVMILLGQGDYDDVSSLLDQLAHAGIPEDLRFIIERYAELLGALGDGLEATERSLDRAQIFLDRGDRAAARQQLEAASSSLSQARRGLEDLQLATDTMARRLGVFGVPAGSRLGQLYDELQILLERLDLLWQSMAATLEELAAAVAKPRRKGSGL